MKIKQKKQLSPKKILLIVGVVILLLGSAVAAYFIIKNNSSNNTKKNTDDSQKIDYSPPTEKQKQAGKDAENQPSPTPPKSDNPPSNNSSTPTAKKPTNVSIVSALQDDTVVLKVRTIIEQIEATPGTCTITVAQESNTLFTTNAGAEKRSSYSTCQGFDITKPQLKSAVGAVTVTVTYSGTSYTGSASAQAELK